MMFLLPLDTRQVMNVLVIPGGKGGMAFKQQDRKRDRDQMKQILDNWETNFKQFVDWSAFVEGYF